MGQGVLRQGPKAAVAEAFEQGLGVLGFMN